MGVFVIVGGGGFLIFRVRGGVASAGWNRRDVRMHNTRHEVRTRSTLICYIYNLYRPLPALLQAYTRTRGNVPQAYRTHRTSG